MTSSPSPWAALLPVALAGTSRQPFAPLPGLTPPLGGEADANPKQLLLTATQVALVQRAGRRPLPGPATQPQPGAAETWPLASPAAARVLHQELTDFQHAYVLRRLLLALHEHRRRLPPHLLPALFRHLKQHREELALGVYATVLGSRGAWLAAQGLVAPTLADAIAGGAQPGSCTPAQRHAYWQAVQTGAWGHTIGPLLAYGLPLDPPAARDQVLWKFWAQDKECFLDAAAQARLAELLAATPPAERPWPGVSDKWGRHRLTGLADSPLQQQRWQRAQQWLHLERPADGPPRLRLTLPTRWNPAWEEEGMENEVSHWLKQLDIRYTWFVATLSTFSPRRWAALWQLTAAEAVALAVASDAPQPVLLAWLEGSISHHDAEYLRLLLATLPSPVGHLPLMGALVGFDGVLPPAEWLPHLLAWQPPADDRPATDHWLQMCWLLSYLPPALLAALLPALLAGLRLSNPNYYDTARRLLGHLGDSADPAGFPLLEAALLPLRQQCPWLATELTKSLGWLRRRHDLAVALAAPPTD